MSGRLCQEAYVVAEYVPGQGFMKEAYEEGQQVVFLRPGENLPLIAEALSVLHGYGLGSNDVKISNFILTESGSVKIIDLSTNTPVILAKVNDILQMKKLYDAEVHVNGWLLKFLIRLMSWRMRLKARLRAWRKKVPAQRPPKIWDDLPANAPAKPPEKTDTSELSSASSPDQALKKAPLDLYPNDNPPAQPKKTDS
jgi:serine/threonine protein kinase